MRVFGDLDLSEFWSGGTYEREEYIGSQLDDALINSVQQELGYELPKSYIDMMRFQNGGIPRLTCHATKSATSWAEDHIALSGIYSIDRAPSYSLCGKIGSKFWMSEWGYPPIGIYFADCPSAGHDMLCLDYRNIASGVEASVVHVDQEDDYRITFVASNFENFIRGLRGEDAFDLG